MPKKVTPNKQDHWLTELIKTVVYAVILVLGVHSFFYKPFNIPSPSMVPTLLVGDYLFVAKFAYGYSKFSFPFSPNIFEGRILPGKPIRGDVVVFRPPHKSEEDWIKRAIGLPGDRIRVIEGVLHVNGAAVKLNKIRDYKWRDEYGRYHDSQLYLETLPNGVEHHILKSRPFGQGHKDNTPEYIVPEEHYFMMGDNRDHSDDSRSIGFIPFENLVGRADLIFFSTEIPTDPDAYWWQPWKWPIQTRYSRTFNLIY